jgi:ATP adenylyltransferase
MKKLKKTEYLDFTHARTDEQIRLMEQIEQDGVCPFCPEYFKKYHPKPILKETAWWIVSENMSPYTGTRVHLIFVYKEHITMPNEIHPTAAKEMIDLISWAIKKYKIAGGSFFVRFGDTRYTGGSVDHLHIQLLSGTAKSDDENIDKLKIKLGYKKSSP